MSDPCSRLARAAAALFVACIGLLQAGCDEPSPAAAEAPVPKVTVTPVIADETVDADEYTGQTQASETVEVRSRVFGYLKSVEFKDGDYVQEGQTLFTIEPDEYQAIHEQSQSRIDLNAANLALAKAKHARNEKLVTTGAVTREEYEAVASPSQAISRFLKLVKAERGNVADHDPVW